MSNNRKRAETLTIRLTKKEKEIIQKKAKKAQLSIETQESGGHLVP